MKRGKNKEAAIELSIGTIVIIVIAMTMLILGLVLVRKIMCSGVSLTDQITSQTQNEIASLFGTDEEGIKCQGEGASQAQISGGGSRPVACMVSTSSPITYTFEEVKICGVTSGPFTATTTNGCSGAEVGRIEKIFTISGQKNYGVGKTTVRIATINVPKDIASGTVIHLELKYKKGTSTVPETKDIFIDMKPVGNVASIIC